MVSINHSHIHKIKSCGALKYGGLVLKLLRQISSHFGGSLYNRYVIPLTFTKMSELLFLNLKCAPLGIFWYFLITCAINHIHVIPILYWLSYCISIFGSMANEVLGIFSAPACLISSDETDNKLQVNRDVLAQVRCIYSLRLAGLIHHIC